jgi:glycosyltransferase involved in cell wall biosynthesis
VLTVAYLANEFPSAVEPYVVEEIGELRSRDVRVVPGTVRRTGNRGESATDRTPEIALWPLSAILTVRAAWLCLRRGRQLIPILCRILFGGNERVGRRLRALAHTFLGACYAVELKRRTVDHIHVHHGYFASWIAMTAARILGIGYSLTLHGSDLLVDPTFMDFKLAHCTFCRTISEYNRNYIVERYPEVDPEKLSVVRLGVDAEGPISRDVPKTADSEQRFNILSVGRLHAVKDHAFLVRACSELRECGLQFQCMIAGEGPERFRLEALIEELGLAKQVALLGHVAHEQLGGFYDRADVAVLTSRSEGIPVVLMEAMARGVIVMAPDITGIQELVVPGETGFLYEPGSMENLVKRMMWIEGLIREAKRHSCCLDPSPLTGALNLVRQKARAHVQRRFHRRNNLQLFAERLLAEITDKSESLANEDSVLQQIQLSVQRN